MEDSEFDALCEGATAEEVKRLRKILAAWASGDEASFPVQMALLTRAQWRAAARLPQAVDQCAERVQHRINQYQEQTSALVQQLARSWAEKITELQALILTQQGATEKLTSEVSQHLSHARLAGTRICEELNSASEIWNNAKAEFQTERDRLEQARRDLEKHRTRLDWFWAAMISFSLIGIGICFRELVRLAG